MALIKEKLGDQLGFVELDDPWYPLAERLETLSGRGPQANKLNVDKLPLEKPRIYFAVGGGTSVAADRFGLVYPQEINQGKSEPRVDIRCENVPSSFFLTSAEEEIYMPLQAVVDPVWSQLRGWKIVP